MFEMKELIDERMKRGKLETINMGEGENRENGENKRPE